MSIRRRIALVSAAAVAVAVALIAAGTFLGARQAITKQLDRSLIDRAHSVSEMKPDELAGRVGVDRRANQRGLVVPPGPGDFDTSYYQMIFANGRIVNVGDSDLVMPPPTDVDLNSDRVTLRSVWVDDVHLRIATVSRYDERLVVQIGRPLTETDALLSRLSLLLLGGGVVGVGLAAGLGLLVARRAIQPISDLTVAFSDIAFTGNFTERVAIQGEDEVANLAREFNAILDELESAKEEQVRLVRDAGHELRTPLTALRTNIEVLERHEVEPDVRRAMLASARAEVEELAALVSEVIDLASDRFEEEPAETFRLDEIAEVVGSRLTKRRGRGVVVTADDSEVVAKRSALGRALSNIVGNADKFSPEGSPVLIDIKLGVVTVTDQGPGIQKHDLPHIFERFYRSDSARSEPGSGLGLAIVEQIIDDHDGEVFARNGESGGAEIGFQVPLS